MSPFSFHEKTFSSGTWGELFRDVQFHRSYAATWSGHTWCNSVIILSQHSSYYVGWHLQGILAWCCKQQVQLVLRLSDEYILLSEEVHTTRLNSDRHTRKKLNNLIPKPVSYSKQKPAKWWLVCLLWWWRTWQQQAQPQPPESLFKKSKGVASTRSWFLTSLCLQAPAFTEWLA